MENLKFNIGDNPRLSEIVQTVLFQFGYHWRKGGRSKERNSHYLFAYDDGHLMRRSHIYDSDFAYFRRHENKEFDLTEIKEILCLSTKEN